MMIKCCHCNGTGEITAQEDFGIGDLMRLHRQNKGFTLRDAEKISGVSNAYISQVETGHVKKPSLDFIVKLCDAYEVKIEDVVNFIKERPKP